MSNESKLNEKTLQLLQVVEYYGIPIYKIGGNYKIVCPFHDDVNPSLLIDADNGSFHCFGCNATGGAAYFVQLMEAKQGNDLSDIKAYEVMLGICSLMSDKKPEIQTYYSNSKNGKKKNADYRELYAESYDYYHGLKSVNWYEPQNAEENEALDYMTFRGFSPRVLTEVNAKVTYTWAYPIIFPIMDNGKFKGWVSRAFDPEISQKRKYLYNTGFQRVTTLAGDYAQECSLLYICEGYLDRLKLLQFGAENSVAILGWKISDDQIKKIRECNPEIIISVLDNDEPGKRGADYLIKVFGENKVKRFCYFDGVKDPGEMDFNSYNRMNNKTLLQI